MKVGINQSISNFCLSFTLRKNAVLQLLLRSSGLDWFDGIADKTLTEFRYSYIKIIDQNKICFKGMVFSFAYVLVSTMQV